MTATQRPVVGTALSFQPGGNAVDDVVAAARVATESGLGTVWLGQRFDYDAISLAGIIGREVPTIGVGTSAVPIFGRQPLLVAAAAQTAQAATHGRFRLGLALGSATFTEKAFGQPFRRPAQRLEEFLTVTREVLTTGTVEFHGTEIDTETPMPTALPGAEPVPEILVAALGARALAVSGRLADGILPYLADPAVLRHHILPDLTRAATEAGRPVPRVVALVPAVVTDDRTAGRAAFTQTMAFYDRIPSYRRVIELSGGDSAADLALVGTADEVRDGLRRYLDAGAAEVVVTQTGLMGPDAERATWEAVADLAR
ncbi:TIGR03564 family F420-dependent LLM class oxidoreductase [Tsukamurella sp. 8F]|uniref:TIGR03564 family F420-dependent LLM class oxidoreductase n=1 Tax=unclassified Tsukamurella TaxID=2633480 RepID=UPI0023B92DD2|nr:MULTISPECIES: TIGR03564 family F420-dependent LLM class oxidoreductase [unclassified Tsukamurella]MDF0529742.1 TIGR03564 family F420-dependent LLM class oxidoreductase [Tsukamurella sp. 8J]MDF0586027.1 TIGR03564 family F420-dependent LLM class oxidoreductase [Tsukamurella sp. 8F]